MNTISILGLGVQNTYVRTRGFLFASAILIPLFFFSVPTSTYAGSIINRPFYSALTDGLVGFWTFDGADVAATRAYDRSGFGNTATLSVSPLRTPGKIGQGFQFNGTSSYVEVPAATSINDLPAMTISAWIYPRSLGGSGIPRIVDKSSGTAPLSGWFFRLSTSNFLTFTVDYDGATNLDRGSATAVKLNTWQHVLVTWDGSSSQTGIRMYINGAEVSYTAVSDGVGNRVADNGSKMAIGNDAQANGRVFDGTIDDVRMYNRVISADEIKRLYKMGGTFNIGVSRKDTMTDNLVGYWTFDGEDVAGVTAYDRSGRGNNGTLTAGPVRAIGKIGQSLDFNGSTQYVSVPSTSSLQITNDIAVSAWVFLDTNTSNDLAIVVKVNAATPDYTFYISASDFLAFYANGLGSILSTGTIVPDGQWHHVLASRSGSVMSFYKDGVAVGTSTFSGSFATNANALLIAGDTGASTFLDAKVDDVRIYNRALSVDEIKRLYKMGATFTIGVSRKDTMTEGLVGLWTFDGTDVAGVTAYDRSGQGNNGTLTANPTRIIGRIGQALSFNGVDNYVNVPTASSLNIATDITMSAWVIRRTTGTDVDVIVKTNGTTFDYSLYLLSGSDNIALFSNDGTPTNVSGTGNALTANKWHHIVAKRSGSDVSFFIDGNAAGTGTMSGSFTANSFPVLVGSSNSGAGSFCDCVIDDVRLYSRALSTDEIKRLYNMGQ